MRHYAKCRGHQSHRLYAHSLLHDETGVLLISPIWRLNGCQMIIINSEVSGSSPNFYAM